MASAASPSPDDDDLFDLWLDQALLGDVEEPAAFCARHGAGPEVAMALQRLAEQLPGAEGAAAPVATAASLPADDDLPFESIGEFRLLRRIGEGGMGTVFLAEQASLGRVVALKLMRTESLASPTARQRFEVEARAVARLRHPHVVTLFGSGEDRGVRYLAMELVPGRGLDERFADGDVRTDQLVRWCQQIGEALASAHAEGIVHRDVKPSNIRIDPRQQAVLLDFGLARDLFDDGPTRTRAFAGSPHYASPEQRDGRRDAIDHRTDVYSLGVVLYEGLTGKLPYVGSTVEAIAAEALRRDPVPVRRRNPRIARDLAVVVDKAMEAEPAHRYATMREFVDDLAAVLELRPIAAVAPTRWRRLARACRRHRGIFVTAACMTVVVMLVSGMWLRSLWLDREQRRDEAARLLREVRQEIADYRVRRDRFARPADRSYELVRQSQLRHLTDEEHEFLQLHSINRGIHWGAADSLFAKVAQQLRIAQELDPDTTATDEVWAEFWLERWADHRRSDDWRALSSFCREQAERHDHDGDQRQRLRGAVKVSIVSDPPGAEVHLFRSIEEADVARAITMEPLERLPGSRRLTRVPWSGEGSLVGSAPIAELPIERGEYVIELRLAGHETVVLPIVVPYRPPEEPLHREYGGRLLPVGTTPPGFVRVSDARGRWPGVFMQEHEVTNDDYLAFVNAERDARERLAQPPRPLGRAPWPRGADGAFALADPAAGRHPVVGVSWLDAHLYARWWNRTHRLQVVGVDYDARLPTRKEWRRAAGAVNTPSFRDYVFGNYFSARWCKSRFADQDPSLQPVRSYPTDVSLYGAYDMAGSAAEWCRRYLDEAGRLRQLCGGSWLDSQPEAFAIDAVRGLDENSVGLHTGFRIVWTPRPAGEPEQGDGRSR